MDYGLPPNSNIEIEPWVDADAVARHIGFNADYVRKMARAGELPGKLFQNGKRQFWRFRLSDIDRSMATA